MQPSATDGVVWPGLCVSLFVCHVRESCKMAEPIEMPFRRLTLVAQGVEILTGMGNFGGCSAH